MTCDDSTIWHYKSILVWMTLTCFKDCKWVWKVTNGMLSCFEYKLTECLHFMWCVQRRRRNASWRRRGRRRAKGRTETWTPTQKSRCWRKIPSLRPSKPTSTLLRPQESMRSFIMPWHHCLALVVCREVENVLLVHVSGQMLGSSVPLF